MSDSDLYTFLWAKCGAFAFSTLWFREDGSIPYMWILGPAKYGQPHWPQDMQGSALTRFTALTFPA